MSDHREHLRHHLRETGVPENLHDGIVAYLTERRPTGSFLKAVLENDLAQAVLRADPVTIKRIRETVLFLHNYAPSPSWGSPHTVASWLADTSPPPELFE